MVRLVITEVAAICAYLADKFPEKQLAPQPGSAERGVYYRYLFFDLTSSQLQSVCFPTQNDIKKIPSFRDNLFVELKVIRK